MAVRHDLFPRRKDLTMGTHPVGDNWDTDGNGWTGVTEAEKDAACARDPRDTTANDHFLTAAWNAERVAVLHGTGHWTRMCVGVGAHGYVLTPPGTDDH